MRKVSHACVTLGRALRRSMRALRRDQGGATLTEFLITLPIFILTFAMIVSMGRFQRDSIGVWARAYSATWDKAIPLTYPQTGALGAVNINQTHANPQMASADALRQLQSNPVHQRDGGLRTRTTQAETSMYGAMGQGGHWGESHERAKGPAQQRKFVELGGPPTARSSDVLGDSRYAQGLLDDGAGGTHRSPTGSGPLAQMSSQARVGGIRVVLAAGMRYGTVTGEDRMTGSLLGVEAEMNAHYNTLVSSQTGSSAMATAIARMGLEQEPQYREMLGIREHQPLQAGSRQVPDLQARRDQANQGNSANP